jgi:signal transduction histidine kinase
MKSEELFDAKRLELAKKQLEIIRNISAELNKFIGLQTKLNNILEILDMLFGIVHSTIFIPDEQQQSLSVYAGRGFPSTDKTVALGKGIVGMAAQKRIPINLTGLNRKRNYLRSTINQNVSNEITLPGVFHPDSQIAIPLLANNELVAVLLAESATPSVFNAEDEQFLLTLTTQIAASIQNSMLYDSMEEKIKTRTAELEQLNQTKYKLFSIISHDLRSPVSSFQGISQLLKHYTAKGELQKIDALSDKIEQSAGKLNFLLDNVLNWSLSQTSSICTNFEIVLLSPFLDEITSIYTDAFTAKTISLSISVDNNLAVFADRNMLSVIFRNLLSNALKFTPRIGSVTITALSKDDAVHIIIADTGIGMDAEKLKTLFTTLNNKSTIGTEKERGTGLGLILVREFIVLNNGRISAESNLDKGTTFKIELPLPDL